MKHNNQLLFHIHLLLVVFRPFFAPAVTVNPCGNNRMVGTHDLAAETARNFQEPEFCRVTEI